MKIFLATEGTGPLGCQRVERTERYLVARLLRRKTKVSVCWLAEQFGLQTPGGMRYGLYMIGHRLADDRKLPRTWRTLDSL
jgi:hypothetical protein